MARPNTAEPRTHRLEARIAPKALDLIKRAAEAKGSSLSDFVVAAAREVAARELEEQNIIRLSAQEQRQFVALLLEPRKLNKSLKRAAAAHTKLISVNVSPPFALELLGSQHKRAAFSCGVEPLDRYFRDQVGQDVRRRATACYVAREIVTDAIAGYYTLAAGSVLLTRMPPTLSKKLPRYPDVPVARLGRLAVGHKFQGRRLGAALLWDAIERAARSEVVVYGVVVDAKDDEAVAFYEHHGFITLSAETRQLVLPLANLREGLARK